MDGAVHMRKASEPPAERSNILSEPRRVMNREGENTEVFYIKAGRSAVRLLREMETMLPLRSDIPRIRKRISRLEKAFGKPRRRPKR
jgi:hypothetical protein